MSSASTRAKSFASIFAPATRLKASTPQCLRTRTVDSATDASSLTKTRWKNMSETHTFDARCARTKICFLITSGYLTTLPGTTSCATTPHAWRRSSSLSGHKWSCRITRSRFTMTNRLGKFRLLRQVALATVLGKVACSTNQQTKRMTGLRQKLAGVPSGKCGPPMCGRRTWMSSSVCRQLSATTR